MAALLDYLRVPSRFAANSIYLNDTNVGTVTGGAVLPPFNLLSRYREPGKINVNTLFDDRVRKGWLGQFDAGVTVMGQDLAGNVANFSMAAFPNGEFEGSRRDASGTLPDQFDNPFRNTSDYNKVPDVALVANSPVLVSMLRKDDGGGSDSPLLETQSDFPFANSVRDSWARHQGLRRVGNITTTRSSVFAIWVTVGRFEVDEAGNLLVDAAGNGIELGSDTGKIRRNRGFFIVDRSIPVAFEPGNNHNIERAVRVSTIIE